LHIILATRGAVAVSFLSFLFQGIAVMVEQQFDWNLAEVS